MNKGWHTDWNTHLWLNVTQAQKLLISVRKHRFMIFDFCGALDPLSSSLCWCSTKCPYTEILLSSHLMVNRLSLDVSHITYALNKMWKSTIIKKNLFPITELLPYGTGRTLILYPSLTFDPFIRSKPTFYGNLNIGTELLSSLFFP